jgi:probable phosphomutase (TIGR03848 family)
MPATPAPSNRSGPRRPRGRRPPASTILLVRHGQTGTTGHVLPGRTPGLHLDDAGRAQAERAGARIGELAIGAVYSSPLERARETAAPIARAVGRRVRVERGLVECDFGEWTGASLRDLMKRPEWRSVQQAPSTFRFPHGESFAEMQFRIVTALDRLRREHAGETIVCVSHADPIKAAVASALGTPLDLFQRVVINTCSVSVITWLGGPPAVLAVNSTGASLAELTLS